MDEKNFNLPTPPADLPIAGFDAPDPQLSARPKEPEDILGSVEGEESTNTSTPRPMPTFQSGGGQPFSQAKAALPISDNSSGSISKEPILGKGKRALVLGLVVIVVLGVLGFAAWYGYGAFFGSSQSAPVQDLSGQITDIPSIDSIDDPTPSQPTAMPQVDPDPIQEKPADTDRDGLTDADEELYGTNPAEVDTDNDGLTDRDEVKVFKTDPSNPDTDGDTFKDGDEVRAGYDPKGPGRLLDIEAAI